MILSSHQVAHTQYIAALEGTLPSETSHLSNVTKQSNQRAMQFCMRSTGSCSYLGGAEAPTKERFKVRLAEIHDEKLDGSCAHDVHDS